MRGHPTVHQIRQLLSSSGSWQQESAAQHLLECERCRLLALEELAGTEDGLSVTSADRGTPAGKVLPFRRQGAAALTPEDSASTAIGEDESTPSFEARLRQSLAAAEREVRDGESLLEELRARDLEEWPELFDRDPRFLSLAVAGELIEHSWALGYQEPWRAVEVARWALDLLDRLPADRYDALLVDDLRLRAWTRVGRGLHLAGKLHASGTAFRRADELLDGCLDPQEMAGYHYLFGLLRKDQRRFEEAVALFDKALELSVEVGDLDRVARILISSGSLHMERGEPERALPVLVDVVGMLDEQADARVALFARSNLANCFIELGDFSGAREMFESCRQEYAASDDSFVRLRALWMEGRIESGLGDIARAESCLATVRSEYLERGQHYDAALVSLHLAELYARTRRTSQVKALAEEMATVFLVQDIPAEAMAALAFFRQAVEQERATEQLVSGVARFLQRAQTDPGLKFRGV